MDRQRTEGGLRKTTGTIKERAGKAIGKRHPEGEDEGHARSDASKAMDAVREVVNEEKD